MQVFNYDDNSDLELFEKKKKDVIKHDETGWRLESFKTKGIRYWRLAKGSRGTKVTKYVGNLGRVRELYGSSIARRKPRTVFI